MDWFSLKEISTWHIIVKVKRGKWLYLLTDLGYPQKPVYAGEELVLAESIEEINLREIGVRLKTVFLIDRERITEAYIRKIEYKTRRFVFYVREGIKDDQYAQLFADTVMSSLAVVYEVCSEYTPRAICLLETALKKGRFIRVKDALGKQGIGTDLYFQVMQSIGVPHEVLDYVWRIVPAIIQNKSLLDAAHYYKESISSVWICEEDIEEVMWNNSDMPASATDRARLETSYQNAYKAIEAIIGEPSREEAKVRNRLFNIGINPDEEVGYNLYDMTPGKEKVIKKLLDMQKVRDKRVAHGKTVENRSFGFCELKDKQTLAQHIILAYANTLLN